MNPGKNNLHTVEKVPSSEVLCKIRTENRQRKRHPADRPKSGDIGRGESDRSSTRATGWKPKSQSEATTGPSLEEESNDDSDYYTSAADSESGRIGSSSDGDDRFGV